MGVVVAAHHIALQQKVAIKFLLPAALGIPGAAPRFLREARSAVAIQSEHVARVLDVGTLDGGAPFMVMEYLTGSDLGDLLQSRGRLSISEATDYVLQASEAIAEAHALGIVHRDLKPANVFLTQRADGSALVKVLDFGLSKPTKDNGLDPGAPSLTATNMVAGSPQYMSPEQVRGLKNADQRADVWALGVILFELLTGQRPFDDETIAGIFAKIAADPPLRPRVLRPDLPPALEATILRCLEKDVSRRVQDVAELARCLEPFAPPEAHTSVERIVRLGGSRGPAVPSAPQHSRARSTPDALEADIPTMAAPAPQRAAPPAPTRVARPPSPAVTAPTSPPARGAATRTAPPARRPAAAGLVPPAELDLELADVHLHSVTMGPQRAPHPAERGRAPSRAMEHERGGRVNELGIGGPIRLLVVAILIAVADMAITRTLGQQLSIGPVRPLWVAGPLAFAGAAWLLVRVVQR